MTVLVTGFEPFGGEAINPAWEAVKALPEQIAGEQIIAALIPTVFGQSRQVLVELIEQHQPALVLCVGQAGGRSAITLERVAINIDDAAIADNAGQMPIDEPVVAGAPSAYFSTLPIKAMVRAIRQAGIPAAVSNTAGTFVCNHLMYGMLHQAANTQGFRAGFMHVPYIPQQLSGKSAGTPSLELAEIARALEIALAAAVTTEQDIASIEGATH